MKYSCGCKADKALTREEVRRRKWCFNCDPVLIVQRREQERERELRNNRTQHRLDNIGAGTYGPRPSERSLTWNPTPEQFFNTLRALSIGDALERSKRRSPEDK